MFHGLEFWKIWEQGTAIAAWQLSGRVLEIGQLQPTPTTNIKTKQHTIAWYSASSQHKSYGFLSMFIGFQNTAAGFSKHHVFNHSINNFQTKSYNNMALVFRPQHLATTKHTPHMNFWTEPWIMQQQYSSSSWAWKFNVLRNQNQIC